jgi:hypothetical protein
MLEDTPPLHVTAGRGDLDMMRPLVNELGADVNRSAPGRRSILFAAAFMRRIDVMRYLVEELGVSTAELYGKWGDTILLYS